MINMEIHLKCPEDFRFWYDIKVMLKIEAPNAHCDFRMSEEKTWIEFDDWIEGETKAQCKEVLKLVKQEINRLKELET
jgi:hypothetical protein